MNDKKMHCFSSVDKLYEMYKDNDYMLQRIYNHVVLHLPNTLETESKNHEKRINLNTSLSEEQQIFIQVFLSKNNYYYLPQSGFFYEYNGKDYFIVKEDDIIHNLLSSISRDRTLLQWKHKTKLTVLKQIKERHLFTSIPETDTIQNVLSVLYPAIFSSKNYAKYFLTILGDNILKKNTHLTFFISPKLRQLLNELEHVSISSIGNDNVSFKFVVKHHESHLFDNYRIIKINETISTDYWRDILKKIGLNLLCVAAHYSNRYEHSDTFLANMVDNELTDSVCLLKKTTPSDIVNQFIEECLDKTNATDEYQIEWKNLHFVWKQFLSSKELPNVIYSTQLKNLLSESIHYDKELDVFKGITSKHLPYYKDFIQFWETTIKSDITEDLKDGFENEFEMEEIYSLFKMWSKNKNVLSEETILKILKHFFPGVEIVEDKFILHIKSTSWDKVSDINKSLPYIKTMIQQNQPLTLISIDDMYTHYRTYFIINSAKFIVSKRYFEKYIYFTFADYVVYDKFLKSEWINT